MLSCTIGAGNDTGPRTAGKRTAKLHNRVEFGTNNPTLTLWQACSAANPPDSGPHGRVRRAGSGHGWPVSTAERFVSATDGGPGREVGANITTRSFYPNI